MLILEVLHIDMNDIIVLYISESHLDKHIHESDTKSNNDKQEVADETIEKIIPNLETNEMQDLNKHIHESDAQSNNDKQEVADEPLETISGEADDIIKEQSVDDQNKIHIF